MDTIPYMIIAKFLFEEYCKAEKEAQELKLLLNKQNEEYS
jgi:hypothetical protein